MQKEKIDGRTEGEVDWVSSPVAFLLMNECTSDSILNDID